MAASYILKAQSCNPLAPHPFRMVIFICSSLPSVGFDITKLYASGGDLFTNDIAYWKSFSDPNDPSVTLHSVHCGLNESLADSDLGPNHIVRRYHRLLTLAATGIPTVHVYGRQDPYFPSLVSQL